LCGWCDESSPVVKVNGTRADGADRAAERRAAGERALPEHNPLATSTFAALLNQHRRRSSPPRPESPRSTEEPARRTARPSTRPTANPDVRAHGAETLADNSQASATADPWFPAPQLAAIRGQPPGIANATTPYLFASAKNAEDTRRRFLEALNASPCIEISHSRTGTRFLLSRTNGAWLLSLRGNPTDAAHCADIQSSLDSLRAQFDSLDLGPLDIIVD
jgi:hypothetical protein